VEMFHTMDAMLSLGMGVDWRAGILSLSFLWI